MRPFSLLGLAPFISYALAGQFPEFDGVIGSVPEDSATKTTTFAAAELGSEVAAAIPTTITPGKLRYVENSGVCETTSGVYQASGYADLTSKQSIWFWFFAARNNSDTAPLSIWLNVGAGYSYGETVVGTSQDAAIALWKMLQIWFADAKFSKYATRNFAIWTESYGGHYGPTIAAYFLDQNAAVAAGTIKGVKINLKVLSVGNGLTDPHSQYPGYVKYAMSNPYQPLVSTSAITSANNSLYQSGGCLSQIAKCASSNSNSDCSSAQSYCNSRVLSPLAGNFDVYDVRVKNPDPYPYDPTTLLSSSSFMSKIGALKSWAITNTQVYSNFASTGDWMRSSRPLLEKVINAGVRTLILSGDADYICNYMGFELMVDALQTNFTSEYKQQKWSNWTVAGVSAGQYKNAGTFSYLRVYQAGHEVPAYGNGKLAVGQAALVYFTQTMQGKAISSA
ncbi:unnamed protein product [Rhizoctonia solani]|uniref:Carboxypeptidase n=1 Tax=Rhizoctonia solani TaxID=456999 RepID=A0A8H3ARY6_9AGAM|nr:unnamed protein product [Rhizoctonia solani]